jgi:hypothetical protein
VLPNSANVRAVFAAFAAAVNETAAAGSELVAAVASGFLTGSAASGVLGFSRTGLLAGDSAFWL